MNQWQECLAMVPYETIEFLERDLRRTFKNVEEKLKLAYLTTKKKDFDSIIETEKIEKTKEKY